MNICVRFTLSVSENALFLVHTAIHALHRHIVDRCRQGRVKLAERTLPAVVCFLYCQVRCAAH